jgi:hypothetical protein
MDRGIRPAAGRPARRSAVDGFAATRGEGLRALNWTIPAETITIWP